MAMFCGSFRLDESSSLRRLGRCSSSLVASELVTAEITRINAYERLSQSMRLTTEESSTTNHHHCTRNRTWTSLLNFFSYKKVENYRTVKERQTTVGTAAEAPRVVAAGEAKKRRSSWIPDPHRRWPVQGW